MALRLSKSLGKPTLLLKPLHHYAAVKLSQRHTTQDYTKRMCGKREYVGFGVNGAPIYCDLLEFPMPAIRFREPNAEICALREKEQGNWKDLQRAEIKKLYRYSFCQTFAEMKAPSGEWKLHLGVGIWACALGILLTFIIHVAHDMKLPDTFREERRQAQLKRMIALEMNPIEGLASKWNYDEGKWK